MNAMQMQWEFGGLAKGRLDRSRNEFIAERLTESPTGADRLMEMICERENMLKAQQRVESNKGAPGVDGMRTTQLRSYLRRHGDKIKTALQEGKHKPFPVRRAEIPKEGGGVRLLGIPTVVDRLIQQAMAQVLSAIWDHTFSDYSYGFRPGRSQHMAIEKARCYVEDGYTYVVDIDLSKFFDRVNHDRLMSRLATRIRDKRVLKLIRAYLNSGILVGDVRVEVEEGTPQGGPLSPLLANIVLDELDHELEKRGLRFVRYADDVAIYVRSEKAAERVKASVSRFITRRLKLVVNENKSAVARPWHSKYLGFRITRFMGRTRIGIHEKSLRRFRDRIREITARKRGVNLRVVIADLNQFVRGWLPVYGRGISQHLKRALNRWIIRRLKAWLLKQWRKPKTKIKNLKRLGLNHEEAMKLGNSRKRIWRVSGHYQLNFAMPQKLFTQTYGLIVLR